MVVKICCADLLISPCVPSSRRRSLPRSGDTTDCLSWSDASPDLSPSSRSSASGTLGLRPRKGGAWCGDQGGIDDRALLHRHAIGLEVGFHDFKDLLAEIVLLQQMPERQNRGLIRDTIADHVDPSCPVSTT